MRKEPVGEAIVVEDAVVVGGGREALIGGSGSQNKAGRRAVARAATGWLLRLSVCKAVVLCVFEVSKACASFGCAWGPCALRPQVEV